MYGNAFPVLFAISVLTAPILLGFPLYRWRIWIFDLHPMSSSLAVDRGLTNSVHSLRAAVLAAYSAKRDQISAISSIAERSRGESILRASSTHFTANCWYPSQLFTGCIPTAGMVANLSELLGRLANAIP